jgi:uncharacterized membrane protein
MMLGRCDDQVMSATSVLLFLALLATGLSAGLFFGWAVSVIPGTRRVDGRAYVTTMQAINQAIVNPAFIVVFVGAAFLLVAATIAALVTGSAPEGWWLLAATVIYMPGVLGTTVAGNLPLNDALAEIDLSSATDADVASAREMYEEPWNRLHNIRTAAAVLALALVGIAALVS